MENLLRTLCFFCLLLLPFPSSSFPLCTNLRQPSSKTGVLSFCPYNGKVCCSRAEDLQLQKKFMAMNISDSSCASAVKSIICATCDPFSAKLFNVVDSEPRSVPILCNSTASSSSSSSLSSQRNDSFCSTVWESCQDVEILNSPFAPALQSKAEVQRNATLSKLTDLWQSESDFCNAFGGNSLCFNGEPLTLDKTDALPPPKGMCLEKIGNGSYINMVAHPDGSNRAFFSSLDTSFGMMGMAFHPNFATNGRFFASFNCDKEKSPGCSGRCACNSDVGCDPSQLGSLDSGEVCKYHTVIAEYSANGTASTPSMAEKARPREVQRIFTLGLPFTANHGGQILFSPADGYLYIMMGDGGSKGDPYNFAQNKKSLLGKIMRVDVDNFPSEEDIAKLDLWGNYSVPQDNPYSEDKEMQPEIWAYGLRNPWRCSFDSERPSYFLCADVGQVQRYFLYLYRINMKKLISSPRGETTDGVSTKAPKFSRLKRLQGETLLLIPLIPSSQCWDTATPI